MRLMLAIGEGGDGGDKAAKDELAEEVPGDVATYADAERLECIVDTAAGFRMIEVRHRSCGKTAPEVRIVGLLLTVVAAGDEDRLERVPCPRSESARALVEVAGVLMEDRGEDGAADDATGHRIGQRGAIALAIALNSRSLAGKGAFVVFCAGYSGDDQELRRIDEGAKGELVLLVNGHGLGVPNVAGVVVLEDAEDALLLLLVDLFHGDRVGGGDDVDGRGGGDLQRDFGGSYRLSDLD